MQPHEVYRPLAHQSHLRAGRVSEALACYAITKCVAGRRDVLHRPETAAIVLNCLDFLRRQDKIKLLAFCVMPDHYHALFVLMPTHELMDVMRGIGKFTAREINKLLRQSREFWQDGYYDHRCRDNDDVFDRLTYIEHNPVRAEFVAEANKWPYSSAFPANSNLLDRGWYATMC
jgi:REP element-mobilizing transposase RayT